MKPIRRLINMAAENGLRVPDSSDTDNEPQTQPQPKRGVIDWLRDDVNLRHTDIPVLACCLVSGLCDSVAVNAAGVFVSMQTGEFIRQWPQETLSLTRHR